jgi:hypothetical protein
MLAYVGIENIGRASGISDIFLDTWGLFIAIKSVWSDYRCWSIWGASGFECDLLDFTELRETLDEEDADKF